MVLWVMNSPLVACNPNVSRAPSKPSTPRVSPIARATITSPATVQWTRRWGNV